MEKADFFANARNDLTGPLDGIRVLECTTSWAGPMAGCMLADLGADVIKVEIPEGEMSRSMPPMLPGTELAFLHEGVNRNKRSMTLDLHTEKGKELFLEIAETADIVVENFLAGTLASWGLGYEDVKAVKPDIIYVSVTGWGQFGPLSHRAGYDPAAQAHSGWMDLNREPDGKPMRAATYLCDDLAGLHGSIGALGALRHRDVTGEGQHVDVALLDAALFQSDGYPMLAAMGHEVPKLGSELELGVPINSYACSEGAVFLTIVLERHWAALCDVMGRPELAELEGFSSNLERIANRSAVNAVIADWCAERTADEAVALIGGAGITVAKINSFTDAVKDPHVLERDMLQERTLADGSTAPLVGPVQKFGRTPIRVRTAAPALGAHTDDVLAELGYDADEIAKIRADGAV